jgi:hypothetical protein
MREVLALPANDRSSGACPASTGAHNVYLIDLNHTKESLAEMDHEVLSNDAQRGDDDDLKEQRAHDWQPVQDVTFDWYEGSGGVTFRIMRAPDSYWRSIHRSPLAGSRT